MSLRCPLDQTPCQSGPYCQLHGACRIARRPVATPSPTLFPDGMRTESGTVTTPFEAFVQAVERNHREREAAAHPAVQKIIDRNDRAALRLVRDEEPSVMGGGGSLPPMPTHDPVNHPSHYTQGDIECIDALESALGAEAFIQYCRAAAIKYLWRMGKKDEAKQELRKAVWYIERAVATLAKSENPPPAVGARLDRVA